MPQHESAGAFAVSGETHTTDPVSASVAETTYPHNLPTFGYDAYIDQETDVLTTDEEAGFTELENAAHAERVLLSSDALRYFAGRVSAHTEQLSVLKEIARKAHVGFPSEEGWVVLNLARMEDLLEEVTNQKITPKKEEIADLEHSQTFVPMTASSLAEAIVTKNITAAYGLIANRPMVALADAARDLDLVYRARKGEEVSISNMLLAYTREFSNDKLLALIEALTTALDGTYHTEEEAVKMAILKATKVLR
jgi:hypothetical protein